MRSVPSSNHPRRRLLKTGAAALIGLTGCLSEPPGTQTRSSTLETSQSSEPEPTTRGTDGKISVETVVVADFVLYPLAGTHPHVHRRADTQYVVVRTYTSLSDETVRERLTLDLDGEAAPLASRQPVPWSHETLDVAFAVSKDTTIGYGQVLFDQSKLYSLSATAVERLNNSPVFDVSDLSILPTEIRLGERTRAMVRFSLTNTGDGPGTFGASLKGNFVSGARTVTKTLNAGAEDEVAAPVEIVGEGDEAFVRLDWGSDEWSTGISVVGTPSKSHTATPTPDSQ